MDGNQGQKRDKVVIIYSRRDESWLKRILVHLRLLKRDQDINIWVDTDIPTKLEEFKNTIQLAKVIVLFVSADLLASDIIVNGELSSLFETYKKEDVIILPLIVSPCRFSSIEGLSQLYPVNDPSKSLIQIERAEQNKLLVKTTKDIDAAFRSAEKSETKGMLLEEALNRSQENRANIIVSDNWKDDFQQLDEYAELQACYEEVRLTFVAKGDRVGEAHCLKVLGKVHKQLSEYAEARACFEEARPIFEVLGDRLGEVYCIQALGEVHKQLNDYAKAQGCFEGTRSVYEKRNHATACDS